VVAILEQAFRDHWGRVLASLIGFLGDFDLAEEAAQEAFAIGAERWPRDGVPTNPGAWLVTTAQIAEGRVVLDRALALRGRGPYVLQAAIASLHADEPRDWPQIAALYGELFRLTGSPVVELSRAVAVAESEGPAVALDIVNRLDLDDYRYLHSTQGELLRRLGRTQEARDAYRRALALAHDDPERRLLQRRLAELGGAAGPTPTAT
jgi:predicted RNA polymerase sigma factor